MPVIKKRFRKEFVAAAALLGCTLAIVLDVFFFTEDDHKVKNEAPPEQEKSLEYQAYDLSALLADHHAGRVRRSKPGA